MWRGFLNCLFLATFMSAAFGVGFVFDRPPTVEADTVAQLGAAFLIAYGVEMSWVVRATNERGGSYETWLGLVTGLALCGLSGIVVAAGLADTGSGTSALREVGFAWSCGAVILLGAMVASTPVLTYEWRRQLATEFDDE